MSADLPAPKPADTYGVTLLYAEPPQFDFELLATKLRAYAGNAELLLADSKRVIVQHQGHTAPRHGAQAPAQFLLRETTMPGPEALQAALSQTWDWEEAGAAASRATYALRASDMMAELFRPLMRLILFQASLLPLLEQVMPLAILWEPAGKMVDPRMFLHTQPQGPEHDLAFGAVNVRLFPVEGAAGTFVMDTLGLGALGLPDLQAHFQGLDPHDVAVALHDAARMVLLSCEELPIGEQLDQLQGAQWSCREGLALAEPRRAIQVLHAGPSFSMG